MLDFVCPCDLTFCRHKPASIEFKFKCYHIPTVGKKQGVFSPRHSQRVTVQPSRGARQTMLLNDTLSLRERRNGTRLENTSPRPDVFQGSFDKHGLPGAPRDG